MKLFCASDRCIIFIPKQRYIYTLISKNIIQVYCIDQKVHNKDIKGWFSVSCVMLRIF